MKIFFYTLTIALLFFSIEVFSQDTEKVDTDLSERQKLFTELVKASFEPVETKWINGYTIDVTYDQALIDQMSEPDNKKLAELIAKLGNEIIHETTCVKITDPNGKEHAYHCVKKNEEFAAENVIITETQRLVAERLIKASAFSQVKWLSTSLLELTMGPEPDLKDLDLDPEELEIGPKFTSKKLAAMIAPWVHENTGKPICIKIVDSNKEELAYKCVGEDKGI